MRDSIKTVGDIRKIIEGLDDDFKLEIRIMKSLLRSQNLEQLLFLTSKKRLLIVLRMKRLLESLLQVLLLTSHQQLESSI